MFLWYFMKNEKFVPRILQVKVKMHSARDCKQLYWQVNMISFTSPWFIKYSKYYVQKKSFFHHVSSENLIHTVYIWSYFLFPFNKCFFHTKFLWVSDYMLCCDCYTHLYFYIIRDEKNEWIHLASWWLGKWKLWQFQKAKWLW